MAQAIGAGVGGDSGTAVEQVATTSPSKSAARWGTAVGVAVYVGLAVAVYWDAWSAGPSNHMQAGGDQFTTVWYLRWIPFALQHGLNPFFSHYGNYPFGVNLLTNTSVPLLGLVGSPITTLFGPIVTYNSLCTLALAGSATAGYAFARRWTTWRPAAWVGGLVYGFSPYEIAQSNGGHLNLTFVVLPPLMLLAVHEIVAGHRRDVRVVGAILGLLVAAQFFISSEVAASTLVIAIISVVAGPVLGCRSIRSNLRRAAIGAAWAVGVAAALLAYPVWFALAGPGHIHGPIQLVPQAYRADLLGPVVPDTYTWLAPSGLVHLATGFANSTAENGSYLGITLLLTLAVGTVFLWRRSVVARVAAVGGLAAFVLSLGGGLVIRHPPGAYVTGFPLPERVFTKLPLLSNTVPVRYSLYVTLFAGLVLALVLDRLHAVMNNRFEAANDTPSERPRILGVAAPAVLALFCLIPLVPVVPLRGISGVTAPAYFTSSSLDHTRPGQVMVLYPYPSSAVPDGQLWQALAGMHFKSPGGYFLVPDGPNHTIGFTPSVPYGSNTLTARVLGQVSKGSPPPETTALRLALLAQFRSWHVSSLIASLGAVPQPGSSLQFLTWLVGRPPVRDVDVEAWHHLPS